MAFIKKEKKIRQQKEQWNKMKEVTKFENEEGAMQYSGF